jgi:hypothetical protein
MLILNFYMNIAIYLLKSESFDPKIEVNYLLNLLILIILIFITCFFIYFGFILFFNFLPNQQKLSNFIFSKIIFKILIL